MRYMLAVLVENHFGVLARVASLISRRGFNIESLAVGPAADRALARMTIVLAGDAAQRDQVVRQLSKLVDVLAVRALDDAGAVVFTLGDWDEQGAAEPGMAEPMRDALAGDGQGRA